MLNLGNLFGSGAFSPEKLIANAVKGFVRGWTAKHAKAAAATPDADIKGINTYIAGRYDVWIRATDTPPETKPTAKRLARVSIEGESFWLYWKKR